MTTDWFLFRAETSPESIAIITAEDERAYTYQDIHQTACQGASYFQSLGIKKGDCVVIIAYNCIEYIYLFSIAQKLGVILVPINYRLTHHEITTLLTEVKPVLVLVDHKNTLPTKQVPLQQNLSTLFNKIGKHKSKRFISRKTLFEEVIFILYTSGSSGKPKGVLYTHKMMFWNSINTMMSLKINGDTSTVICMPPFHTGGWNVLLTPLIHLGGTSILLQKFEPETVLHLLEKYNCSIFMGVPTMLKMIALDPNFGSTKLKSLDYIIVGGEAMPLPLIDTYHEKGIFIRQGYGMTEAGPNLTSLHEREVIRKMGSIGKPNMYVEMRIVTSDGSKANPNERGELQIKGPMTMKGYFNRPQETSKTLKDGWLSTGDIAIQDEEGFIYIVDRIKNMFISGGENVYPAEVERVLLTHPKVSEAAVVGLQDEKWGEVGRAFIVVEETISEMELQTHCRLQLAKFKVPKSIIFLDGLPKNETGKINRKSLKDWSHN